jgi:hypothetical protein
MAEILAELEKIETARLRLFATFSDPEVTRYLL